MALWIATATRSTGHALWDSITRFIEVALTIVWDNGLTLLNVILPRKAVAPVRPPFVPRIDSDSRSPCPALNALAGHGIFPHDGRGIKFTEMAAGVQKHYNCAPSFCFFVSSFMATILHRDYRKDTFDLGDLCVHNGIEHDGSMTRFDTYQQPDQSVPSEKLIHDILAASRDGKTLTPADLSRVITRRRAHSKATNPQFSLDTFHAFFGANNAASLIKIVGGDVKFIKPFLLEERLSEDWKPAVQARMGLTMAMFNPMTLRIFLGVDPAWQKVMVKHDV